MDTKQLKVMTKIATLLEPFDAATRARMLQCLADESPATSFTPTMDRIVESARGKGG